MRRGWCINVQDIKRGNTQNFYFWTQEEYYKAWKKLEVQKEKYLCLRVQSHVTTEFEDSDFFRLEVEFDQSQDLDVLISKTYEVEGVEHVWCNQDEELTEDDKTRFYTLDILKEYMEVALEKIKALGFLSSHPMPRLASLSVEDVEDDFTVPVPLFEVPSMLVTPIEIPATIAPLAVSIETLAAAPVSIVVASSEPIGHSQADSPLAPIAV